MRPAHALLLCGVLALPAHANPYLEQVEQARPGPQELERAREQLAAPRPEPLAEPLFVPPFHHRDAVETPPATLCRQCHQAPPHHGDPARRAFLNMHGRYLACESCHWRPAGMAIEYRYQGSATNGLIVPVVAGEPVVVAASDPRARCITEQWSEADPAAQAELKARLHQPLSDKGPGCGDCHSGKDSLLDPDALGYDRPRADALRLNPVARFLERTASEPGEPVNRIHLRDLLE